MKQQPSLLETNNPDELIQNLTYIRHHLHQFPELSNQEEQTSKLVAQKLQEWGYQVSTGIGGYGVVGTLTVGNSSRSIGIRAEMDALPIQECSDLPYASQHTGTMHACGHDGHTTMLLGAAQQLAKTRQFSGTINLIFQPAEEIGFNSGAQRMIEDGLFELFPCDAIFGLHNHPGIETGTFLFCPGPFMAACDTVSIVIKGKGGHAARPHQATDPIVAASSLVMFLQTIISRNVDPTQAAVITVGSLHSGHAPNVIPDSARLEISVRSFHEDVRAHLEQRIREGTSHIATGYGCTAEIDWKRGYPVLVNHPQETDFAKQIATELVGAENVISPFPAVASSEDFAYFLQHRPGCFLRLGNGKTAMLHNAAYDFNDENLAIGTAYWTRLVERFLPADSFQKNK